MKLTDWGGPAFLIAVFAYFGALSKTADWLDRRADKRKEGRR